jgi:3-methyladenine DNA glycosylase AlkD
MRSDRGGAIHGPLARAVRRSLRAVADPQKAPFMQAYMRSKMPYLGVQAPALRRTIKPIFAAHPLASQGDWQVAVLELWRGARFREERYAAIELAGLPVYRCFRTFEVLPMYEEMIVSGAWWDYVDAIATQQIGELLAGDPAKIAGVLRDWALGRDLWKRRTAILAQLKFKSDTDLDLLYHCILASAHSKEFFLRKGIGWALREYAKTNPEEVKRFVRQHETLLSPLTRREALKNL